MTLRDKKDTDIHVSNHVCNQHIYMHPCSTQGPWIRRSSSLWHVYGMYAHKCPHTRWSALCMCFNRLLTCIIRPHYSSASLAETNYEEEDMKWREVWQAAWDGSGHALPSELLVPHKDDFYMFACLKLLTRYKMVRFYYLYVTTYGILNSSPQSCAQFYEARSSRLIVYDKPVKINCLHA